MEKYDLEYKGVKCTGVDWDEKCNLFYFEYRGENYIFPQLRKVNASADTDHIRIVIEEQFLPMFFNSCEENEEITKAMDCYARIITLSVCKYLTDYVCAISQSTKSAVDKKMQKLKKPLEVFDDIRMCFMAGHQDDNK